MMGITFGEDFIQKADYENLRIILDRNRESIISDVVYFEGEKDGIPVEVALTYNTSILRTFRLM